MFDNPEPHKYPISAITLRFIMQFCLQLSNQAAHACFSSRHTPGRGVKARHGNSDQIECDRPTARAPAHPPSEIWTKSFSPS